MNHIWKDRIFLLLSILFIVGCKAQLDDPVEEILDASILQPSETSLNQDTGNELQWNELGQVNDNQSQQSFLFSLLMIIVSEIGDKTFLIAAIMAMKHSRLTVFAAAFLSLLVMSVLSAGLGHVVPNLIPKAYTDVLAALLFWSFGLRMLYEGYHMKADEANEEMQEVEEELKEVEERDRTKHLETLEVGGLEAAEEQKQQQQQQKNNHNSSLSDKLEQAKEGLMNLMQLVFSPVFVQTFILTFLGEWGDRSQISTIALAAANNVYWVTAGVVIGHSMCTGVAVMGGRLLASKISVRTVTLSGAILFLIFGSYYTYHAYTNSWST
ncbi:uncharacterized protein BX664DRAFT_320680 [Halteromyces radiatus]|uniref:uncharacterized protein n=1 Tax=Halteromyces radiatus TaxID=101107 RepID=UPI00221EFC8C|nr:uncharacterized protein BX664DRAFT_320680 [Halteromyces radiatus]KAI8099214.1 hypothetical protein BX664DRAFT_320680 [Halteromyces radiatus]